MCREAQGNRKLNQRMIETAKNEMDGGWKLMGMDSEGHCVSEDERGMKN